MRWQTANNRRKRPSWVSGRGFRNWCIFGRSLRKSKAHTWAARAATSDEIIADINRMTAAWRTA